MGKMIMLGPVAHESLHDGCALAYVLPAVSPTYSMFDLIFFLLLFLVYTRYDSATH